MNQLCGERNTTYIILENRENREKCVFKLTSIHQAAVSGRKRKHVVAFLHDRHVKRVVVNAPVCFVHTDWEAGSRVANGVERRVRVQRGVNCGYLELNLRELAHVDCPRWLQFLYIRAKTKVIAV